jgi:hypothetical protein
MMWKPIHLLLILLTPAVATAHELCLTVPLEDGRLTVASVECILEQNLSIPAAVFEPVPSFGVSVDLHGFDGWMLVRALNSALAPGLRLQIVNDDLAIFVDPSKLPNDWNQSCDAIRKFTQVAAPLASARQRRRLGLHLPQVVDPNSTLVILVHGLDGDSTCCTDLANLLHSNGFQTATLAYPAEQPLEESSKFFADNMLALHDVFPNLRIELVTESMGGLIARQYVEGPSYAGGVDHFILIAPPNDGSHWTWGDWIMKLAVNASEWKNDPDWSPAWMITEGLCQAASDLHPNSEFLARLNELPRRQNVKYTIIAGDRPIYYRYEATMLGWAGECLTPTASRYALIGPLARAIERGQQNLLTREAQSDGPVNLTSAQLTGVTDFQTLRADHIALYESVDGQPPAAYSIILDRLKN